MSTYQSFQSATALTSDSVTITKPVSLAVGDLMLASIYGHYNSAGTMTMNTPAGWTLIQTASDVNFSRLAVYSKVADSADVAASDFTFTCTNAAGSSFICGYVVRFTNFGIVAGSTQSGVADSATTLTASAFTPTYSNCTFVFFAANFSNINYGDITTYAIATNNPTWTERSDFAVNSTNYDGQLTFATASRPEATSTGTVTLTRSVTDSGMRLLVLVALAPRVDGSISADETKAISYTFTPIQSVVVNSNSDAPTTNVSTTTQWANETPVATDWVNESL